MSSYWDQFGAETKARLEVGTWPAIVRSAEESVSRAGNKMVVLTLGIECNGAEHERKVYVPLHVGWRVAQMKDAFPRVNGIADIEGKRCEAECIEEEWTNDEGEKKKSVKPSNILPAREDASAVEDDDDVPF